MNGMSLVNYFIERQFFPIVKLAYNVGYFSHFLLICISELKCCEKHDKITYNFGVNNNPK